MKIKTIFTILLTAIITIALFQNSELISVKFLFFDFQISKLVLIGLVFVIGLIVGLLWAAPSKKVEPNEPEVPEIDEVDKDWLN
jgi:Lipopolysaccharide assembly protein A domain